MKIKTSELSGAALDWRGQARRGSRRAGGTAVMELVRRRLLRTDFDGKGYTAFYITYHGLEVQAGVWSECDGEGRYYRNGLIRMDRNLPDAEIMHRCLMLEAVDMRPGVIKGWAHATITGVGTKYLPPDGAMFYLLDTGSELLTST